MVAGVFNPLVAAAVGHRHGNPYGRDGEGRDGIPALRQFINDVFHDESEEKRNQLIATACDDGLSRLAQLRHIVPEDLAALTH